MLFYSCEMKGILDQTFTCLFCPPFIINRERQRPFGHDSPEPNVDFLNNTWTCILRLYSSFYLL